MPAFALCASFFIERGGKYSEAIMWMNDIWNLFANFLNRLAVFADNFASDVCCLKEERAARTVQRKTSNRQRI